MRAKGEKAKGESANPWEKVLANVEVKEGGYKGTKEVNRMKEVMMGRKGDFKKK